MESKKNTLIIIPSETRNIDLTYDNLKKYIIKPNNADIGCFISEDCPLTDIETDSKYVFKLPEYNDHIDGLFNELKFISKESINKIKKRTMTSYQKSTFIHVYYRLFILRMLKENNLIDKYDWFIINRSDLKHTLEINVEELDEKSVYLPNGEFYYGLPDRFAIISKKNIEDWLNIFNEEHFIEFHKIIKPSQGDSNIFGPEKMTKYNKEKKNINIKFIKYSFFCVKKNDGQQTNIGSSFYHKELDLIIKYKKEYYEAIK